jgi:succinoglycan biosynthesis transport protein ExoP
MIESPEAYRFISYMVSRWRLVAGSCLTAVVLATTVSLILPRQYTATARILIEPPAGADPRSTLAVSQIYLESLKTYEYFANSDSLFQKAANRFQLRALAGAKPIESLKKQVLKIGIVRNTRILEIGATVPDARRAQSLAQYIAAETVGLNGSLANGERLTIIDPGVIPERPSSPNVPLNVAAALLFGLLFPAAYLAVEMNLRQQWVLDSLARRG